MLASRVISDSLEIPRFLPAVEQLIASDGGEALVGSAPSADGNREWLVLSAHGRIIGRFALPAGVHVLAFSQSTLWGTVHDDLDVPYVVRYRLDGRPAATRGE